MITTDYSWKFDYEITPDEQDWHELFIKDFECKLESELNKHFSNTLILHFNFFYFPKNRKFYVKKIYPKEELVIKTLKLHSSLWNNYFEEKLQNF